MRSPGVLSGVGETAETYLVQIPATHWRLPTQLVVQLPQCCLSFAVSTQVPLHNE